MANAMLTINMITREAVRLWKNTNAFIQNIDTQYDASFAQTGAKIGTSLRIRLPNDYVVRNGPAAQVQDTTEPSTTLVVATQKGVDVAFSSVDRTMSLDDYSKRILAPAVNNLAGSVAADVMAGSAPGIANIVVWPKVMEKYRKEVMGARLILVEGYIQSSPEEVTHLVAQRLTDRSHDLVGLANASLQRKPAMPEGASLVEPLHDDRRQHPDNPAQKIRHPRNVRILPPSRDFH